MATDPAAPRPPADGSAPAPTDPATAPAPTAAAAPLRGKSMRGFDYFGTLPTSGPAAAGEAAQLLQNQAERRRQDVRAFGMQALQAVLALTAIAVLASLLWSERYWFMYVLRPVRSPLKLGSVTTLHPSQIPHNAFVSIEGVTGRRGVSQKATRGLSFDRREWWYVELLGSQGVFIQVPDDPERYGPFTQLRVEGRAVDPAREACCDAVFKVYQDSFRPLDTTSVRVLQVDALPGTGRAPYVIVLLVWFVLVTSGLMVLLRVVQRYRGLFHPGPR